MQEDFFDVRENRVDDLRERVGAGTYHLPGETIAECLMQMPVGELTPEQIALLTEPVRRQNQRAARRLAPDPTKEGWCNTHQRLYNIQHGFRHLDCPACFEKIVEESLQKLKKQHDAAQETGVEYTTAQWRAQNRQEEYLRRREAFQQQAFSQEGGMRQDAGVVSPPESELFLLGLYVEESPKPERFSWIEWTVILLFTGVVVGIIYQIVTMAGR